MKHKTILITGCSSGLGLSLTKLLLQHHWQVIATIPDNNLPPELAMLKCDQLTILKLDVTNAKDRDLIKDYIDHHLHGALDCLINNAGYGLFGPLEELTENQIRHQFEVNLYGTIFVTQSCLPALRKAKGCIINISSLVTFIPIPLQSIYSATKSAIEGLSASLYHELAPHGVQVMIIQPGLFQTNFEANASMPIIKDQQSPYFLQKNNFYSFRKTTIRLKNKSPDYLAKKIAELLSKRLLPARKRIGWDINYRYLFWYLTPASIFNKFLGWYYKRIFLTPNDSTPEKFKPMQ